MPLSSIPIDWETVGAFGTALASGVGAGWAAAQLFGSVKIKTFEAELNAVTHRAVSAESSLEKAKLTIERANERILELATESAHLKALLDRGLAGDAAERVHALEASNAKFVELKNALLGAEDDVWRLKLPVLPSDFEPRMLASKLKVLTVANLKGGVGKTTLVANLAAHFSVHRKMRVLIIDFDYQGSLTRMVATGAGVQIGSTILADELLGSKADGKWIADNAKSLDAKLPRSRLIPCGPTFDGFESRMLLRWLIGEVADDVRFRLANMLLSREIQDSFDLVLIDSPPRQSLGMMNALCASHAVMVPTIADRLSVDAVQVFLERANRFRSFNPALMHMGVVATLTEQEPKLLPREASAMDLARESLSRWHGKGGVFRRHVPHLASISKSAGRGIGYFEDEKAKSVFDQLGEEVYASWLE